jgi:hypothetical protein
VNDSSAESGGSSQTLFRWNSPQTHSRNSVVGSILSDRPFFSASSATVGVGVVQLETGYFYAEDIIEDVPISTPFGTYLADLDMEIHSFPQILFRVGLYADWLEFQVGYSEIEFKVDGPYGEIKRRVDTGVFLGTKLWLSQQSGFLPELSVLPHITVAEGSSPFTVETVFLGIDFLYSWQIKDRVRLFGSTSLHFDFEGEYPTILSQAAGLKIQHYERLSSFAEFSGSFSTDDGPAYRFQGGMLFLLTENVQFDLRAGTGLNHRSVDFFAGTGLSIRF